MVIVDAEAVALYELGPPDACIIDPERSFGSIWRVDLTAWILGWIRKGTQMFCELVRRAAVAAVVVGSFVGVAAAENRAEFAPGSAVSVMSKPSEQRKLSFPQAGIIKESPVKEGDKVQAGMVLLRQD